MLAKLDAGLLRIIDLIEIAATQRRAEGNKEDARALFRLRASIREGRLPYEEAQRAFNKCAPFPINS